MTIENSQKVAPVAAPAVARTGRGEGVKDAARPEPVADRVSVAGGGETIARALDAARAGRADRLARAAQAVETGAYRADPRQLAARLLDDAEVTARLRGMLRHEG